jgi:hypothetical protein
MRRRNGTTREELEMPEAIQPTPLMDVEGLKCYQDAMRRSQCYLEYGSGGSTVYAANVAHVPLIISVEADRLWCERVKTAVSAPNSRIFIEHCDIGDVGEWGTPKSRDRIENFWTYATTPWRIAKRNNFVPDTVLIDGRFRVASFLFSLVSARIGTTILFDDYLDRPQYFVVEEFCQLQEKRGRMGVFLSARSFSVAEICEKIAQYSVQWA